MKTFFIPILVTSIILLALGACNQKKEKTCGLIAASVEGPSVTMTITFTATQTGDGVIETLTYTTSNGVVTVHNPGLPWTATAEALAQTPVSIVASGTVKSGSLKISFEGSSGGSEIQGSDYCSQE